MKKYIIIVSVYDQENTCSYPLGGVFATHKDAEDYIAEHWQDVKNDHWASGYVVGDVPGYHEEFTMCGGWFACDDYDGASIEIEIHTIDDMSGCVPIMYVSLDDLEENGYDTTDVDQSTLEKIADRMNRYMSDDMLYSDALYDATKHLQIPRKEE